MTRLDLWRRFSLLIRPRAAGMMLLIALASPVWCACNSQYTPRVAPGQPTATSAVTQEFSADPVATVTPVASATLVPAVPTYTSTPTSQPTDTVSPTAPPTDTAIPTDTAAPTPTPLPSPTSTPVPSTPTPTPTPPPAPTLTAVRRTPTPKPTRAMSPTPKPTTAAQATPATGSGDCPYIGNKNSLKFHLATCEWAAKTAPKNRVCLQTREEAISKGFVPCKVCKP